MLTETMVGLQMFTMIWEHGLDARSVLTHARRRGSVVNDSDPFGS